MCYHCNRTSHISNVCPARRVVAIAEEIEEEDEREGHAVENNEYAGVEFAEEESDERVNFLFHRILLSSKDEGKEFV